jgi:hypothetical protein
MTVVLPRPIHPTAEEQIIETLCVGGNNPDNAEVGETADTSRVVGPQAVGVAVVVGFRRPASANVSPELKVGLADDLDSSAHAVLLLPVLAILLDLNRVSACVHLRASVGVGGGHDLVLAPGNFDVLPATFDLEPSKVQDSDPAATQ